MLESAIVKVEPVSEESLDEVGFVSFLAQRLHSGTGYFRFRHGVSLVDKRLSVHDG